ncbi:unnamed protein product [Ilex paraguariensis]|uniref:K-box domain-containing protein n=1 Tax=Ilex paraguariensis TaxID=185542 RepID=A0ABC8T1A9_9AQUA
MEQVIGRHSLHPDNPVKLNTESINQPSFEMQLENCRYAMLCKEVAEKSHELRKLRGQELQGLDIEELMKLEKLLEGKLSRVQKIKGDKVLKEIDALKKKVAQLMEENAQLRILRQQTMIISDGETNVLPQGYSPQSILDYSLSADPPLGHCASDTSLKLSLPFPN